jgi:hypothetical protein
MAASTAAHMAFAFVALGGWAMFANRAHALPEMLRAGLVQGAISCVLTFPLKKFLEWFNPKLSGAAAMVVPPVITASSIAGILVGAHTLAGTPEVVATIAVPFTVSTSYAIFYNLRLCRERRA